MSFYQLRSLPGIVWPPVPVAEFSQLWAAYLELDRTQWLSSQEIETLQFQQLRALLAHCYEQSPYYHRLLTEAGFPGRPINSLSDFRRLPVLTRDLYQTHFADLKARNLPAGMLEAGSGHTSGTNGVPIKVLMTNRVGQLWRALFLRDMEWSGLDPRGKIASIRLIAMTSEEMPRALEGISQPFWNKLCRFLFENGSSHKMDVRQDPRRQLEWLQRIRPNFLLSMPTNLEFLASLLQESGQCWPELRVIQAVGESLSPDVRQRIESGFGVPVKNLYSTTEVGYMASPCPSGNGLHVHSENFLAEVLDADNQPCLPGQTGRLVLTTLHNFLTPFIRYEILDDVTLAPGPCSCGRGLPLWTHVSGRRHPLLFLPDGRKKSSIGLTLGIRKVGGCHQFQIVQRAADHVIVRIVPDRTWQPDHVENIRRTIHQEFETPIRVDVELKDCLERPAGGKLKIVLIEMEDGARPS